MKKCAIANCTKDLDEGGLVVVHERGHVCWNCSNKLGQVEAELGPAIMEFHARALIEGPNGKTPELIASEKRVNELRELERWLAIDDESPKEACGMLPVWCECPLTHKNARSMGREVYTGPSKATMLSNGLLVLDARPMSNIPVVAVDGMPDDTVMLCPPLEALAKMSPDELADTIANRVVVVKGIKP